MYIDVLYSVVKIKNGGLEFSKIKLQSSIFHKVVIFVYKKPSKVAKKLLYQELHTIVYSIFFTIDFIAWPPQKSWPSDKANHEKYAINYCMSFKELKAFLIHKQVCYKKQDG